MNQSQQKRQAITTLERAELAEYQLERLNAMLRAVMPENAFYREKLAGCNLTLKSLDELAALPLTTKEELIPSDANDHRAVNHTYPWSAYSRMHQTSGTRGRPLIVLDTADDWRWWSDAWQYVLDAARISTDDRAMLAFSFGPFIGFWSAHDAIIERGAMVVPGGGMSTRARLELIERTEATVVFCTPTYALRMAEVAAEEGIDLASGSVRSLIVAGEPGGSVPAMRAAMEKSWGAQIIDHSGATEVGPWGFGDPAGTGLWVNEAEFVVETLSLETDEPAKPGELAELVLTSLGRYGCPVIRYRTGDLVRPRWTDDGPCRFVFLEGGVLGRADDMMIIRGVNVFPSSIDNILRSFPEVVEYRMTATRASGLDALRVEVEDRADQPEQIAQQLQIRLGLKIVVETVPSGTLPRFEAKGQRFVDERK